MKKIILLFAIAYWGTNIYAQQNDTTRIKLGETKVIIIENQSDNKLSKQEKLEKGKVKFDEMLSKTKAEIEKQQKEKEAELKKKEEQQKLAQESSDVQLKKDAEKKVKEIEGLIKEKEKKIKDLEKEMASLENGIKSIDEELANKDNWKKEGECCHKREFDWDFDDDWPSNWEDWSPFDRKKKSDKFQGHWAGFELGFNNYVNSDYSLVLDGADANFEPDAGRSMVFSFNFAEFNIPFGKRSGIVTGIGTSFNHYNLRNNVNIVRDPNTNTMVALPETAIDYDKNTLNTWTFSVPLILEFQLKKAGVYFGGGAFGKARVASWGKQYYKSNGEHFKIKRKSDYLMNTFRYGLTFRAGFKYLKLYANYDMVPLFQQDRGPELYPIEVGLVLVDF